MKKTRAPKSLLKLRQDSQKRMGAPPKTYCKTKQNKNEAHKTSQQQNVGE